MPFPAYSQELFSLHTEELEFLWSQRPRMVRSSIHKRYDLENLDSRIEAHAQAILLVPEASKPWIEESISGDDPGLMALAVYLRMRTATEKEALAFWQTVPKEAGPSREAVIHGLC